MKQHDWKSEIVPIELCKPSRFALPINEATVGEVVHKIETMDPPQPYFVLNGRRLPDGTVEIATHEHRRIFISNRSPEWDKTSQTAMQQVHIRALKTLGHFAL